MADPVVDRIVAKLYGDDEPAESSVPDAARLHRWVAAVVQADGSDKAIDEAMALADREVATAVLAVQADNNRLTAENAELKHRLRHLENLATYPDQRTADNNRRIEAAEVSDDVVGPVSSWPPRLPMMGEPDLVTNVEGDWRAAALSALAEAEARAVQEFDIATGYMNERDSLASALAEIRRLCDEADESAGSFLGIRVNNSRIDTSAIRAALPEED